MNLTGLAFVPGGYAQGAQDYLSQLDLQALQALGRGMQGMPGAGGVPMPPASPPSGVNFIQRLLGGGGGPAPGVPPGPSVGGGPPPITIPGTMSAPGTAGPTLPAGPPPGAPTATPGASGGTSPAPVAAPPTPSPAGGGGAPQPFGTPGMSWQQLTERIVRANPGAPPEVIAAAVTKAIPLMSADSQSQWRAIQAQLAQERINLGEDRLNRRSSEVADREERLNKGLDERIRSNKAKEELSERRVKVSEDREVRQAAQAEAEARRKATQYDQTMDFKKRQQAIAEWQKKFNELDRIQRAKIAAMTNLTGKQRKEMVDALDKDWQDAQEQFRTIEKSYEPAGGAPAPSKPTSGAGAPGARDPAAAVREGFSATGSGKPLPKENRDKIDAYLKANPGQRDAVIQKGQQDGWDMSGF